MIFLNSFALFDKTDIIHNIYILSDMTNSMLGKLLLQFPPSKIWNYVCYLLLILYPKWGTYLDIDSFYSKIA